MQCQQCKYVLSVFDEKCTRCGFNPATDTVEAPKREYAVKNAPILYPFPKEGKAFIDRNGQRFGPYTVEEINSYLKSANLLKSDLLLTDQNEWVVLRRVQGVVVPPPPAAPVLTASQPSSPTTIGTDEGHSFDYSVDLPKKDSDFVANIKKHFPWQSVVGLTITIVMLLVWASGYHNWDFPSSASPSGTVNMPAATDNNTDSQDDTDDDQKSPTNPVAPDSTAQSELNYMDHYTKVASMEEDALDVCFHSQDKYSGFTSAISELDSAYQMSINYFDVPERFMEVDHYLTDGLLEEERGIKGLQFALDTHSEPTKEDSMHFKAGNDLITRSKHLMLDKVNELNTEAQKAKDGN